MSERWTELELAQYVEKNPRALRSNPLAPVKPSELVDTEFIEPTVSKYNNQKTPAFGIMFASKKEANRYEQLKLMESGGVVRNIKIQVRYRLEVNGVHICDYIADFVYLDKMSKRGADPWVQVVEDTKGVRTAVYKLKKKLMLAIYGIEIRET